MATLATVVVGIGVLILGTEQAAKPFPGAPTVTFDSFFSGFGTILFAFGGHALFPTLQVDMKEPRKFGWVMAISYFAILCLYIPVSVVTFYNFGLSTEGMRSVVWSGFVMLNEAGLQTMSSRI